MYHQVSSQVLRVKHNTVQLIPFPMVNTLLCQQPTASCMVLGKVCVLTSSFSLNWTLCSMRCVTFETLRKILYFTPIKLGGVTERCGNVDHVKTTLGLVMIS